MPVPELPPEQNLPAFSFDPHFVNVPHIEEIKFDPVRCARLFTHPAIGIAAEDLPRIHVFVQPSYKLGHTDEERRRILEAYSSGYPHATGTALLPDDCRWGAAGDVQITIGYDAKPYPNALLCHQAIHARSFLKEGSFWKSQPSRSPLFLMHMLRERRGPEKEQKEEEEANRVMKDISLRGLRRGIIQVSRTKKVHRLD
jgi:hypothetical protein